MAATSHEAELHALRDAIKASKPVTVERRQPSPVDVPEPSREESELIIALRELKDGLMHAAESADDVIVEHPVASVGAAFLLGLAVGRLMRGL